MEIWTVTEDSVTGLECSGTPDCWYCKVPMKFYCAKPMNFPINDDSGRKNAYAIDVEVICPKCGYWDTFGVPISKEHYVKLFRELVEMTGGRVIERAALEKN